MFRSFAIFLAAGILMLAPLGASAATTNFFGPIVPDGTNGQPNCNCPGSAPDWGCVLQTVQNAIAFGVSFILIMITLMIAYSGIMFMVNPTNAEQRSAARSMVTNAFIGLVIVLCSWLIIDFVMKQVFNGSAAAKTLGGKAAVLPWNAILGEGAAGKVCFVTKEPPASTGVGTGTGTGTTGDGTGTGTNTGGGGGTVEPVPGGNQTPSPTSDNKFDYQAGIQLQAGDASSALNTLLSCMVAKVPANVGQISSISDSRITSGSKTFAQCAAGGQGVGCAHQVNSCHYGGKTCTGSSYAVDFGDEQNAAVLTKAANACGASLVLNEGNHLHVSIGSGCSCDGD